MATSSQNQHRPALGFLRTLTTCHCPHSRAARRSSRSISPARRALSSKPAAADRQTGEQARLQYSWRRGVAVRRVTNCYTLQFTLLHFTFTDTRRGNAAVGVRASLRSGADVGHMMRLRDCGRYVAKRSLVMANCTRATGERLRACSQRRVN